jgi:hypothetical protein
VARSGTHSQCVELFSPQHGQSPIEMAFPSTLDIALEMLDIIFVLLNHQSWGYGSDGHGESQTLSMRPVRAGQYLATINHHLFRR